MAITILSESYGPRKPFITCEADSLDELEALVCAEGSTATVGGTEYTLDRVNGWIVPGSGGGGGGSAEEFACDLVLNAEYEDGNIKFDKTYQEIRAVLDPVFSDKSFVLVKITGDNDVGTAITGGVIQTYDSYNGVFRAEDDSYESTSALLLTAFGQTMMSLSYYDSTNSKLKIGIPSISIDESDEVYVQTVDMILPES